MGNLHSIGTAVCQLISTTELWPHTALMDNGTAFYALFLQDNRCPFPDDGRHSALFPMGVLQD